MKTVFFDRDGTIIVDPPDERVDTIEKIELFPDTIEALKYLADNDFNIVIITNQAGIAEGRISEQEFWDIQETVLKKLAPSRVEVLKTYMNGDAEGVVNDWRKPAPGMLLKAVSDFDLNISNMFMVGDHLSDVQVGINA